MNTIVQYIVLNLILHKIRALKQQVKVKVSPLQAMKAHRGVDARFHIFISTALGRGRVISSTLGRLYPRGTHFIGG